MRNFPNFFCVSAKTGIFDYSLKLLMLQGQDYLKNMPNMLLAERRISEKVCVFVLFFENGDSYEDFQLFEFCLNLGKYSEIILNKNLYPLSK